MRSDNDINIVGAITKLQKAFQQMDHNVPLSPSNLLTMKSKVVMPSPGSFGPGGTYCHKRWRRTQHIINEFWARQRKEFIQTLQEQKSCRRKRRNFQKGDVVLLKADSNRNHWPIALIIERRFPINMGLQVVTNANWYGQ